MIRIPRRRGFTLIEMIVVMTIMVTLIGLAALVLPALKQKNVAARAGALVQGSMSIAKQRAIRDQAPRGLRLVWDGTSNFVTELQYVEQPEPAVPVGPMQVRSPTPMEAGVAPGTPINYLFASLAADAWTNYAINFGDYLDITYGGGRVFRIVDPSKLSPPPALPPNSICLQYQATPVPFAPLTVSNGYRVLRSPRPLVGEPTIVLPPDTAIDLQKCYPVPLPVPPFSVTEFGTFAQSWGGTSGYFDIMFNSAGQVADTPHGRIILWVTPANGAAGAPTLIAIYTRTGQIQAFEAVPGGADPYLFTRDGRGSGL